MKRKLLSDLYKILKFFQNDHQLIITQKDSSCRVFIISYQEKVLENDNKNSDENITANSAAVVSNLKDKKIYLCEQKH